MSIADRRLVLIDDHAMFADLVSLALRVEGYDVHRLPLTGSVDTLQAALSTHASVALIDLDLGLWGDGDQLIGPLTIANTAVAVVTGTTDQAQWGRCLQRGACAVLNKNGRFDGVLNAVRRLSDGQSAMPRAERARLVDLWDRARREDDMVRMRFDSLTVRERQVLCALVAGHGVHEIAAADLVSELTVRTQVRAILSKLDVGSQLAAAGLAHRLGWEPQAVEGHRPIGAVRETH